MIKMSPRERAALLKRVKQINQQIQDPRLTIERCDELHKEREDLAKKLLADRNAE